MTTVADHYRKDVKAIPAGCSALEAADALQEHAVGALVVLQDGKPVGIVTDRDLLERVIAEGKDAGSTTTAEFMSEPLQTASPADPLDRVADLMSKHRIRRVPVVDGEELVGIVALDDVFAEVTEELKEVAEGARREITAAQRAARARAVARDVGERMRDLGQQLEHVGADAKDRLVRELDALRERITHRGG